MQSLSETDFYQRVKEIAADLGDRRFGGVFYQASIMDQFKPQNNTTYDPCIQNLLTSEERRDVAIMRSPQELKEHMIKEDVEVIYPPSVSGSTKNSTLQQCSNETM